MRLLKVEIANYKSIWQQSFNLSGLTVLFGANSAGKTNLLEKIAEMVGDIAPARVGVPYGSTFDGDMEPDRIWFELGYADVAGSPDHVLASNLWLGRAGEGAEYTLLSQQDRASLGEGATIATMREVLADALVGGLEDPDRRCLAEALVATNVIVSEENNTWLVSLADDLPGDALSAARKLDSVAQQDDFLTDFAHDLVEGHAAWVESLGAGFPERTFSMADVVMVDSALEGLEAAIDRAIDDIDDRLHRPSSTRVVRFGANPFEPWLEEQAWRSDNELPQPELVIGPANPNAWYRVRPALQQLADELSRRANSFCPSFISQQGSIEILVIAPTEWRPDTPRTRVMFREPSNSPRGIRLLGAATSRWCAAALRLAVAELGAADWSDDTGQAIKLNDAPLCVGRSSVPLSRRFGVAAEEGQLLAVARPTYPTGVNALYLFDEPEANLHPGAVRSVVEWLHALAQRTLGVVVATHNRDFLSLPPDRARLVYLRRSGDRTELVDVPGGDIKAVDGALGEVGITRGDLLQQTRLMLFVEGPHDQIVLGELIGDELAQARIRLVPMHGTKNMNALIESEIVGELGIQMGVLTDNTRASSQRKGRPTAEEDALNRLQQEARVSGRSIRSFGLSERDILQYLHVDACRELAPRFPGWTNAAHQWRQSGSPQGFKQFVTAEYGLRLDRRTIQLLARRTREIQVPPELQRLRAELTSFADGEPTPSRAPE
ncbi:MAG: AAA family ATPase [Microthrixaceae bacterium]